MPIFGWVRREERGIMDMVQQKKIIKLIEEINNDLDHFVPCVNSEIEAKSSIHKRLGEIRQLAWKIGLNPGGKVQTGSSARV